MRSFICLLFILIGTNTFSQEIKFRVLGQGDTTVNLVRYFGKGLYYSDTAQIKKGMVTFDGSKQKPGILALYLPGNRMLEFVYNNEDIYIETRFPDIMKLAEVKKSSENKIFFEYVHYLGDEREKTLAMQEDLKKLTIDSDEYKALQEKIKAASGNVKAYQLNLIAKNPDKLVSKIIKMSMDVEIPEAPKDKKGNIIDSNYQFNYYRAHYWDNVDFTDDRLVRTPIFHNKLEKFFSKDMMIQHWDTVIHYGFEVCDKLNQKSDMFQYTVSWITSEYEKSKIMGMDKVFVRMGERYYCSTNEEGKSPAFWMTEKQLEKLCDRVKELQNTVLGIVPPNIILRDTTDVTWRDLYSLKSEYTILYFWDPECGHCKKVTPKLQTLYAEKFRDRNIEIFAVGKAVGEDFEKWKAFIKKNHLEFINVAVTDKMYSMAMEDARQLVPRYTTLESLNYQQTFDVFTTPKVIILNKNKEIIGKSLSISQIEEMLDRLQGKADAKKLFPISEEPKDERDQQTSH